MADSSDFTPSELFSVFDGTCYGEKLRACQWMTNNSGRADMGDCMSHVVVPILDLFLGKKTRDALRLAAGNALLACSEVLYPFSPLVAKSLENGIDLFNSFGEDFQCIFIQLVRKTAKFTASNDEMMNVAQSLLKLGLAACARVQNRILDAVSIVFASVNEQLLKERLSATAESLEKYLASRYRDTRVAAVSAIGALFLRATEYEAVIGAMKELLRLVLDQYVQVRLSVVDVASDWSLRLPDRWSYMGVIVAILVASLSDESGDVADAARNGLKEAADEWASEQLDGNQGSRFAEELQSASVLQPRVSFNIEASAGVFNPTSKSSDFSPVVHNFIRSYSQTVVSALVKDLSDASPSVRSRSSIALAGLISYVGSQAVRFAPSIIEAIVSSLVATPLVTQNSANFSLSLAVSNSQSIAQAKGDLSLTELESEYKDDVLRPIRALIANVSWDDFIASMPHLSTAPLVASAQITVIGAAVQHERQLYAIGLPRNPALAQPITQAQVIALTSWLPMDFTDALVLHAEFATACEFLELCKEQRIEEPNVLKPIYQAALLSAPARSVNILSRILPSSCAEEVMASSVSHPLQDEELTPLDIRVAELASSVAESFGSCLTDVFIPSIVKLVSTATSLDMIETAAHLTLALEPTVPSAGLFQALLDASDYCRGNYKIRAQILILLMIAALRVEIPADKADSVVQRALDVYEDRNPLPVRIAAAVLVLIAASIDPKCPSLPRCSAVMLDDTSGKILLPVLLALKYGETWEDSDKKDELRSMLSTSRLRAQLSDSKAPGVCANLGSLYNIISTPFCEMHINIDDIDLHLPPALKTIDIREEFDLANLVTEIEARL